MSTCASRDPNRILAHPADVYMQVAVPVVFVFFVAYAILQRFGSIIPWIFAAFVCVAIYAPIAGLAVAMGSWTTMPPVPT